MTFVPYELFYRSVYSTSDDGERVAVIIHDLETQEVEFALSQPGTPSAPSWMDGEDAERVVEQLAAILHAPDEHTIEFREPTDPAFSLKRGMPFDAENMTTATYAIANDDGDTLLYIAFTIEFRPNLKSTETFPVAVFVLDPRIGRLVGHVYGPENPHAPRTYNRRQQKIVGRHLDDIFKRIAHAQSTGERISPFKNMGPQFRSERLPSIDAVSIDHALVQAIDVVERYTAQQAS